jgi:hypothetical protein
VYVNNWLEQNIDPSVTESGANKDKLAALGQRYQEIANRAIELGADPNDVANVTAKKVDKVAGDYQTYYNDTHENTFMKFLLAAGGVMLGAYGLSQVLGGAGAGGTLGSLGPTYNFAAGATPAAWNQAVFGTSVGTGAAGFPISVGAPAYTGTTIPTNIFSTPTFPTVPAGGGTEVIGGGLKMPTVPGGAGSGAPGIKIPAGQGLAPDIGAKVGAGAQQIGAGSVGLQYPGVTPPPGGLSSYLQQAKDVVGKVKNLTDAVSGGQQQQQQPQGGLRKALTAAELYPQSNIMIPTEKYLELTTPRRTFVGGLGAMRNEA